MDVNCYEPPREGPRDSKALAAVCARAEADAADAKLCAAQDSCGATDAAGRGALASQRVKRNQ